MEYSGGGYVVVQQLVEDVTHEPFAQWMDNTLLTPLHMTRSTFKLVPYEGAENYAYAHPSPGVPLEGGWNLYPESTAAGLWTTPTDLAKLLIDIQNSFTNEGPALLNQKMAKVLSTPVVSADYGLGYVVEGKGENLELSHDGRNTGFFCGFVCFPYLKKGAIVMLNAANELSIIAGNEFDLLEDILRSIAAEYHWPSYIPPTRKSIELSTSTLEKYIGKYEDAIEKNEIFYLNITKENNTLYWKSDSGSYSSPLYAISEKRFISPNTGYEIEFKETNGIVTSLVLILQPGNETTFKKL
jgi:CubicO group peptidase (beta-lactamase class C family)